MQYTIQGELAQVANLTLENGETCWASKGSIVAMDPGLVWTGVKDTGKGASLSEIGFHNLTRPKSYHLRKTK